MERYADRLFVDDQTGYTHNSLYGTSKGLRFKETAQRPVIPLVACSMQDDIGCGDWLVTRTNRSAGENSAFDIGIASSYSMDGNGRAIGGCRAVGPTGQSAARCPPAHCGTPTYTSSSEEHRIITRTTDSQLPTVNCQMLTSATSELDSELNFRSHDRVTRGLVV